MLLLVKKRHFRGPFFHNFMKSFLSFFSMLVLLPTFNAAPVDDESVKLDMSSYFPNLNESDFVTYGGLKYVRSSARIQGRRSGGVQIAQAGTPIPRDVWRQIDKRIDRKWYPDMETIWDNNCYNFATNTLTNTFAQPGVGGGLNYLTHDDLNDCKKLVEGAKKDGLIPTANSTLGNYDGERKNCHFLAAMVGGDFWGNDYHWFRLMKPGTDNVTRPIWFHKPGGTIPLSKDFSGKPIGIKAIFHPKTRFDSGLYTKFCGLFLECGQPLTIA